MKKCEDKKCNCECSCNCGCNKLLVLIIVLLVGAFLSYILYKEEIVFKDSYKEASNNAYNYKKIEKKIKNSKSNEIIACTCNDDFDSDCKSYNVSKKDMLKIIDPHVMSSAKSRYNNKLFIGDTIFICTNTDILRWYMGEDDELREAFFRRIRYVMTFDAISQDMITYITVNEIQNIQGHRDLIPIKEMKVDLKPYIEKNTISKHDFLDTLDDLTD